MNKTTADQEIADKIEDFGETRKRTGSYAVCSFYIVRPAWASSQG
ncbi:hypothetical protein [Paenibacillus lentus]|nr:hypothetical protein [Paenibacillus lentus]